MLASIRSQCAEEHKPTQLLITDTKPPYLSVLSMCSSVASDSSKICLKEKKKRKEKTDSEPQGQVTSFDCLYETTRGILDLMKATQTC